MTDDLSLDFETVEAQCATRTSSGGSTSTTGSAGGSAPVNGGGRPGSYLSASMRELPSVTDVLDGWKHDGVDALMGWAAKLQREGKNWKEERDRAADFGTAMHELTERIDLGEDEDSETQWGASGLLAVREYLRYLRVTGATFAIVEMPLVSETYGYGGTFDRLHKSGRLGDIKTSKQARVSYVAQLGAYAQLLRENGYGWPTSGEVLCLPKEAGKRYALTVFSASDLITGRDAFLRCLDLHRMGNEIARLIG
jgi:hypothetical protein